MRGKIQEHILPPDLFGVINFCRLCIKLHKTPREIDPTLSNKENIQILRYISIIIAEEERAKMLESKKMEKMMKENNMKNSIPIKTGNQWVSKRI